MESDALDYPVVVISDDDPQMVRTLVRQATTAGLWAVPDTASQVQQLARMVQPALVILDINQKTNGLNLLRALKSDPLTKDVKVIVLSGSTDPLMRKRCLELGADEYVTKPFDTAFIMKIARTAGAVSRDRFRNSRPKSPS